ncbi:MAG: hypothetical protein B5M48_01385 [Candidatus Omnitrophica bacterium 4484_213]|nr:MAG: hypothetical protein B5M48_01385 [Candidatus Omnitrophica bacterium 4484_213]
MKSSYKFEDETDMKDIFVINYEDVRCLAEHEIGRELTIEELRELKKRSRIWFRMSGQYP